MKVVKFGGTSLASGEQLKKVFEIVVSDSQRKIVVVSAPGKRFPSDTKVTDLLIACGESWLSGDCDQYLFDMVIERYRLIAEELSITSSVVERIQADLLEILSGDMSDKGQFMDAVKASGEDNNAKLVAAYFQTMGVVCHYNVEMKELNLSGKTAGHFAGYAVMTFSMQYFDYRRMMIKRFIDICGGLVGSLITVFLTPFVALAIKIESRGPVFFAQTRIGKNGRRFKILKFRSMYIDAEERKKELAAQNEMSDGLMFKMENDPRITKVGKFIRKTSIDEFPQFFNILKGDMSLVGTRPPTEDEFEQYSNHYRRRMSITPGLTGMWQVKGRGKVVDFDEVVKLDLEYIDHWSLSLDFKIMLQTVGVVLFGRGAK